MINRSYYFESITQRIHYPLHYLYTTSPRKLLFGINFLLTVCSICVAGFCIYLCRLLYEPEFTSGWINFLGMSIVSLCLVVTAIVGMRGAHLVSLELLLSHFWLIMVFIAPLLLGLFSCFNFYFYTEIWFKHSWELPNFLEVRRIFCDPPDTADNKCIAPLNSDLLVVNDDYFLQNNYSVTTWCKKNYNATDCEAIRDSAISRAVQFGGTIITAQSTIGLVDLFILAWSIYICHQILTAPIITQSMMDVINYLLILPIAGCLILAIYFWWIQDLDLSFNWFPLFFLALAIGQIVALPLGIISGRMKSRSLLSIYIALMVMIALGFGAVGSLCWALAKIVIDDYSPDRDVVVDIACRKNLPGCTGCDLLERTCDEWPSNEVLTLISLDIRLAGMVAMLCILYIVGGLVVSSLVEQNLKHYKYDFV